MLGLDTCLSGTQPLSIQQERNPIATAATAGQPTRPFGCTAVQYTVCRSQPLQVAGCSHIPKWCCRQAHCHILPVTRTRVCTGHRHCTDTSRQSRHTSQSTWAPLSSQMAAPAYSCVGIIWMPQGQTPLLWLQVMPCSHASWFKAKSFKVVTTNVRCQAPAPAYSLSTRTSSTYLGHRQPSRQQAIHRRTAHPLEGRGAKGIQ